MSDRRPALGLELTAALLSKPVSKFSLYHPWIPVHLIQPAYDEPVLVAHITEDGQEVHGGGRDATGTWWVVNEHGVKLEGVAATHYMPMPDPPLLPE